MSPNKADDRELFPEEAAEVLTSTKSLRQVFRKVEADPNMRIDYCTYCS